MDSIFGYAFRDEALLAEALTTPAYRMQVPQARDNQRLEFLGDAVLGLLAADRLYRTCPIEKEGPLTVRRTHMVSTAALCEAAVRHGIVPRLRRNRGAEPLPETSKTLADAVEAVIGAVWLDGGFDAARTVFDNLGISARAEETEWAENPKGELQVRAQALQPPRRPVYTLVRTTGRAHDPHFTVRVAVDGFGEAVGEAGTHKEAEARAAAALLETLKSVS